MMFDSEAPADDVAALAAGDEASAGADDFFAGLGGDDGQAAAQVDASDVEADDSAAGSGEACPGMCRLNHCRVTAWRSFKPQ
jgi:hypothetical protein